MFPSRLGYLINTTARAHIYTIVGRSHVSKALLVSYLCAFFNINVSGYNEQIVIITNAIAVMTSVKWNKICDDTTADTISINGEKYEDIAYVCSAKLPSPPNFLANGYKMPEHISKLAISITANKAAITNTVSIIAATNNTITSNIMNAINATAGFTNDPGTSANPPKGSSTTLSIDGIISQSDDAKNSQD